MVLGDDSGFAILHRFSGGFVIPTLIVMVWLVAGCSQNPVRVVGTETETGSWIVTEIVKKQDPTPAATAIPPKPTQTATFVPQTQAGPQPAETRILALAENDLLYVSQGKLFSWKYLEQTANQVLANETFPNQSVKEYDLDPVHSRMVVLQSRGMVANGMDLLDLTGYDFLSGFTTTLQTETTRLEGIQLSPDGMVVAYLDGQDPQGIYVQPVEHLSVARRIWEGEAGSEIHLGGLVWSTDNRMLAWSDARGVWVFNSSDEQTRQVVTDTLRVASLDGKTTPVKAAYSDLSWSPAGRYLSAWVHSESSSLSWRVILDSRTGRVVEMPGTIKAGSRVLGDTWMQDGRLFILRKSDQNPIGPIVQVWNLLPANAELLVLESEHPLDFSQSPGFPEVPPEEYIPSMPITVEKNVFSFLVSTAQSPGFATLALFDLRFSGIQAVGDLPIDTEEISWTLGGTAGLAKSSHGAMLLILPRDGVYDLLPLLGNDAGQAVWLP